jgi:signal transduction histidine kinase/DNA-binding response OmpR family regulator
MRRFRIILGYALLWLSTSLCAQQGNIYSSLDTRNGLSENRVRYILQLPDGRMVFSTEGITNLYDGNSFTYIHLRKSDALPLSGFQSYHREYVDDRYIWLKYEGKLLLMSIAQERSVPHPERVLAEMGVHEPLADFFLDDGKNYWMRTTSDRLLYRPQGSKKAIVFLAHASGVGAKGAEPMDLAVIGGKLYLFYRSGWMVCYDIARRKELYRSELRQNPRDKRYNSSLFLAKSTSAIYQLWSSPEGKGLIACYRLPSKQQQVLMYTDYWLNTPSVDPQGRFWVSCRMGMWVFDASLRHRQFIDRFKTSNGSEVTGEISSQFHDAQGGRWIGTFNQGLLYYHPNRFTFSRLEASAFPSAAGMFEVTCFAELPQGILVGTTKGAYRYAPGTGRLVPYPGLPERMHCLTATPEGSNAVWLCTANEGVFHLTDKGIRRYGFPSVIVRHVCRSSEGRLYAATDRGLGQLDAATGRFQPVLQLQRSTTQLIELDAHRLLGNTRGNLFVFDKQKGSLRPFLPNRLNHINPQFNCLYTDTQHRLWIGTQDGLCLWMPQNDSLYVLYTDNGLINNSIKSIVEDAQGRIWVGTAGGISRITVHGAQQGISFTIVNFDSFDGVLGNEFALGAAWVSSKGTLFVGGMNGFNLTQPTSHVSAAPLPRPLFTGLMLFGNRVKQGVLYQGHCVLPNAMAATRRIVLQHRQNFIGIEFAALNYQNPTQTYFRYRLESVDEGWRESYSQTGKGVATYTDLSPGNYRFMVESADNHRVWTKGAATLLVEVKAPFWATPWAYLCYLLMAGFSAFLLMRSLRRRSQLEMARRNEEKLNRMKFRFFTTISHEFRTPLTLILNPIESLLREVKDSTMEKRLRLIYRHAIDLNHLVNQLLDFRRLEMHGESLQLTFGDLVEFLNGFEELYLRTATEKQIRFEISSAAKSLFLYFDKEKLYRIVTNLLSNAFKYTPSGGTIRLRLDTAERPDTVVISVSDTGRGIPEKDLPHIFNRFFQAEGAEKGSGIGLHLVKEYVQLHGGTVSAWSQPGQGTTLRMELPTGLTPLKDLPKEATPDLRPVDGQTATVLVVEDNDDLRSFLVEELSKWYRIREAGDGESALHSMEQEMPDLVVTDVTMPRMNGLELCQRLKSDLHTSHLPVVLLTARTSEAHRMEGFQSGADEYLEKPFSLDLLHVRIAQLLERQRLRKESFSRKMEVNPKDIVVSSLDEQLIEKALECIERHMDDTEFSVQQFSEEMGMDRTVLYKKLQGITGLSPSEFIRSIRLKRAAQLLRQGQLTISEVMDRVGFNTPKYFTRHFREAFGMTPSQFQAQQKQR